MCISEKKKSGGSFLSFKLHQKVSWNEVENQRAPVVFSDPRNLQSISKQSRKQRKQGLSNYIVLGEVGYFSWKEEAGPAGPKQSMLCSQQKQDTQ